MELLAATSLTYWPFVILFVSVGFVVIGISKLRLPAFVALIGAALILRIAQGSATVAMLTTSAMLYPLSVDAAGASTLPVHQMYLFLTIGFWAFSCSWMNDSGFWVGEPPWRNDGEGNPQDLDGNLDRRVAGRVRGHHAPFGRPALQARRRPADPASGEANEYSRSTRQIRTW